MSDQEDKDKDPNGDDIPQDDPAEDPADEDPADEDPADEDPADDDPADAGQDDAGQDDAGQDDNNDDDGDDDEYQDLPSDEDIAGDGDVTYQQLTGPLLEEQLASLTVEDQVQFLKKKQRKQERQITILRNLNNKKRDELKRQAKELEKIVDQNVKKQIAQEQKESGPYNYLGEQQILKEILEKKKTKEDFKDVIDARILDELQSINSQLQSNTELRNEIQAYKARTINLNFVNKIRDLTNLRTMKEKQKKSTEDQKNKLGLALQEQNLILQQLNKDYNYKEKIESLRKEQASESTKYKNMQLQESIQERKSQKQSKLFSELEKIAVSHKLGLFGNPMDLDVDEIKVFKKKTKDVEGEGEDKMKQYYQRNKKITYMAKEQNQAMTEQEKKLLDEFRKDNNVQLYTALSLNNLRTTIEDSEKKFKVDVQNLNNTIAQKENELKEINKKYKEKDHEAQVSVTQLNMKIRVQQKSDKPMMDISLSTVLNQKVLNQKDDFKKSQKKQLSEPRGRGFTRLVGGSFADTESSIIFDDTQAFLWKMVPPRLVELIVYHSKKGMIYGIQGKYKFNENSIVEGPLNYTSFPDLEKTILKIKDGDYLRFISGFFAEQIFYLRIETHQRESIEVGDMKLNDSKSQEFRMDVRKDQIPIALTGILDFTKCFQFLFLFKFKFMVAIGIELQMPFDPLRIKRGLEIEEKIDTMEYNLNKDKSKSNLDNMEKARKIKYKLKKLDNNSLLKISNDGNAGSIDTGDPHYQFQQKEKLRMEMIKLDLMDPKKFNTQSYKDKSYIDEEKRRKELSKIRSMKVEAYVEQNKQIKGVKPRSPSKGPSIKTK